MSSGKSIEPLEAEGVDRALREHLLSAIIDNSPSVIFIKAGPERRYLLVNQRTVEFYGRPKEEIVGKTDADFFPPEVVRTMRVKDDEALQSGQPIQFEESVRGTAGLRHYLTTKFPVHGLDGSVIGVCGIATDVTAQKRAELERSELQEQIILAQSAALRELSTPLMPIADGVLAMPLVGAVDATRAAQIMAALLEGISRARAHTAILDITGVRTVDAQVASALVGAARAARLLGARVVLTGIRAEVAETLVRLETDLGGIVTLGTLQAGIAYALAPR